MLSVRLDPWEEDDRRGVGSVPSSEAPRLLPTAASAATDEAEEDEPAKELLLLLPAFPAPCASEAAEIGALLPVNQDR